MSYRTRRSYPKLEFPRPGAEILATAQDSICHDGGAEGLGVLPWINSSLKAVPQSRTGPGWTMTLQQLLGVLGLILQSSPTSKPSLPLTASQKKSAWNASKAICCSVPLLRQQQQPWETATKPWEGEFQSLKSSEVQESPGKEAGSVLRTLLTGLCLNIPASSYFASLCREAFLGYPYYPWKEFLLLSIRNLTVWGSWIVIRENTQPLTGSFPLSSAAASAQVSVSALSCWNLHRNTQSQEQNLPLHLQNKWETFSTAHY